MKGAGLGSKYWVSRGKMLQMVICSLSGLSFSRHGSMTPCPLSARPRFFAYHSFICCCFSDLKKIQPKRGTTAAALQKGARLRRLPRQQKETGQSRQETATAGCDGAFFLSTAAESNVMTRPTGKGSMNVMAALKSGFLYMTLSLLISSDFC